MKVALITAAAFASVASAIGVNPANDTFYSPPDDYASKANGEILKSREVPNPLANLTYQAAYQIMYRSEDSVGNATYGVTTVIVPNDGDASKLVSYQWYEDASYIGCAPSYQLQQTKLDSAYQDLLDLGFYVNTPDYEGPESQFTAGIQAGHSTLDSIRAALASTDITGVSSDAKVSMWGYSGGSIATGWAAQMQPFYASELSSNLQGAAIGGVVANITAVAEETTGTLYAGFLPAGFLGLAMAYPQFESYIKEELLPNATALQSVLTQCMTADLAEFAGQDFFSYFESGRDILYDDEVAKVLDNLTMGDTAPTVHMFMYQGIEDEIAPVENVDELVDTWCSAGASINYIKGPGLDHVGEQANAYSVALSYVSAAVEGSTFTNGCGTTTTTSFNTANSTKSSNATATRTSAHATSAVATGSSNHTASISSSAGAIETNPSSGAGSLSISGIAVLLSAALFVL